MKSKLLMICMGTLVALSSCLKEQEVIFVSFEEQMAIDLEILDEYLADNNITAQTDPSGLRYVIREQGNGPTPELTGTVRVGYEGTLLNGDVFDSNEGTSFQLNNLIEGWQIGIPLIQEGGDITLYIPSGLAYGPQGIPGFIPANANLIFTIQLMEVTN
ncbi:MAG: FKBP-type peptidyl-prolyl cis-trans isomerase [Cytophagales bacterium]|nr:FKBP-type peptidyl-prolyl cis-trans isomerase [Cytophagales bacterium]